MRTYLLYILLVAIFLSCSDLNKRMNGTQKVYLWPDSIQNNASDEIVLPSQGDNIMRITDVKNPSMEVHFTDRNSPRPAVLVFPGGGYGILAYDLEGTEVAEWLNSLGITAIVVKYTVPNNRESAFADGQRAIKIVKVNAAKWNIVPSKIGVLGFSAGAHLAARLSTDFKSLAYQKVDSIDILSSRPDFGILVYPAYLDSNGSAKLVPEIKPSEETPPIFIVQTEDDSNFVSGTKIFSRALDSTGVDHKFHLIEKGGHGYGLRADTNLEISKWPDLLEDWLVGQQILK